MISFKVDQKLKKLIQEIAEKESRTLSSFVTNCVIQYLKDHYGIDWHKAKKKPSKSR
ncbi:MAG: hypothetical protein JW883_05265 [Deltaproteobacteria bacterium]|nr:hypothetical protein [Deltaproteobacteria bacterium]